MQTVTPLETQITISAVVVYIIEVVKRSKFFPWLTTETAKLNRYVAIVLSGLAALGINATFTDGTLTITGLTVAGILTGALVWLKSFIVQQGMFKILISSPAPEPLVFLKNPPPAEVQAPPVASVTTP